MWGSIEPIVWLCRVGGAMQGLCTLRHRRMPENLLGWQRAPRGMAEPQAGGLLLLWGEKGGRVMDAVKFIEERRRMCKATKRYSPIMLEGISPKDIVKEVEEWSAAHPRKTRQDVFLEQWPEAKIGSYDCLSVCPYLVSAAYRDKSGHCVNLGKTCDDCRREFWTQEVE